MLSIVIPAFNEGIGVEVAHQAVSACLAERLPQLDYEIIFVDDGSADDTFDHLRRLAATDARVKAIRLLTNVGAHMAIRAGMEAAQGEFACFLSCDLQDPPELIPDMLSLCTGPIQVVWAVRQGRNDGLFNRVFAMTYHFLAHHVVSKNMPPNGSSMMLVGSKALKALRSYGERNLTIDGFFGTAGFAMAQIPCERRERQLGSSKWNLAKKIKITLDFFTAYSYVPIRAMSALGVVTAFIGLLYALLIVAKSLITGITVPGWTSLMIVILLIGGIQITMLGVLGEYIWRGLDESRRRPRYMVDETLNMEP